MVRTMIAALVLLVAGTGVPASAQDAANRPEELVLRAEAAVLALRGDARMRANIDRFLPDARAVLIIPRLVKGGFIVGGEGGSGVLMARQAGGQWSAPAFFTLGAASIGFQVGATVSEVMFVIMSGDALSAILEDKVKLGGDIGIAIGPLGAGAEASTTTAWGADIYAFAISQGLFGGGAFEGAVIQPRTAWNETYYGQPVTARAIIDGGAGANPHADQLRATLGQF